MARIIEMCGAPGVGKSTLFAEVLSKWKKANGWIPGHYLYPVSKIRWTASADAILSLINRMKHVPDPAAMKKAGELFVSQNSLYVDACWNNIFYRRRGGPASEDVRFHAADYWFKIFQKIQVLQQSTSLKLALIDEGLIQRIDSVLYKSATWEEEKEEIADLLNIMVLPYALIYVETNVEENISRLKKRKKVIAVYKNLPEEQLQQQILDYQRRWNYVCELLDKRGMPILRINSTNGVQANATTILHFLEEVHQRGHHTGKIVHASVQVE